MSIPGPTRLTFHTNSFFELTTPAGVFFIDPVFSQERRGRRVPQEVRSCDYVVSTSTTPWFDDVLDVLDACEAIYVASPSMCKTVSRELGLRGKRLLDLEAWERASEKGLRITALPMTASLGMENAIKEGTSIVNDIRNVMPRESMRLPLIGQALPLFENGFNQATRALSGMTSMARPPKSMDRFGEVFGVELGQLAGGRPGLGYLFELEAHPSLMHLADGVHAGTPEADLEDMAGVCEPDVLVIHAQGLDVEPLVRAVRVLNPKTVLLYRSTDPYAAGRRGQTTPIGTFVAAIEEGAPGCKVQHLRKGDSFTLERLGNSVRPKPPEPPIVAAKP